MKTLTLLRGYPGAGKSTLTERLRAQRPGLVVLNRDDARMSMFGMYWGLSAGQEKMITDMHMHVARTTLQKGGDVVIDATNLRASSAKDFADLAVVCEASFDVIDVNTDAKECIRRDKMRQDAGQRFVGADVIEGFAKRYPQPWPTITARVFSEPKWEAYSNDADLPSVIICDLDGTVALFEGVRGPYDTHVENDLPNTYVINALTALWLGLSSNVIFFSGRKEEARFGTEGWLRRHVGIGIDWELYMREDNDNRKDSFVKYDLFNEHIRDKYNVVAVLDDRKQVCDLWWSMGLPLFRVGDPSADF